MTSVVSNLEKSQINYLKTSFAELKTEGKKIFKQRPAYEQWSYKVLETIALVGGYIAGLGIMFAPVIGGVPLFVGALGIGALTVAAIGLKKLIFDKSIKHINLPQKCGMCSNVDFFDDLEKKVFISFKKYTSKLSVSRANLHQKIETKLGILSAYIKDLETNHKDLPGFDEPRIRQIKDALQNLKASVVVLKAVGCLTAKNKTGFESCIKELDPQANPQIKNNLDMINDQFDRACKMMKQHEGAHSSESAIHAIAIRNDL